MIKANSSHPLLPWIICFVASLFFFYEFIQMNMLDAISTAVMQTFSLSATQFGKLSATYFYANILFLFPAGMILDRFSTRKVMLIALSVCVLGTFAFALASSALLAGISRFLTGIGSAFCFLSCIRLASRWFPAKRMALVSGLVVTMAMLGGMVAQAPLTLLIAKFGWRNSILIDGFLGVIILALIYLIVRDYPPHHDAKNYLAQRQQLQQLGFWQTMRGSYLRIQNWLCGIYTCLLNLPIFILGGFLGIQYLGLVHHLSEIQASSVTSMLFLGTTFGAPVMGWFSDRVGLRKLPMILGAILSMAVVLIIMYAPNLHLISLMLLFLGLGFITSTQVVSYPTVAESNSTLLTATAVSVVSICVISGGAIFDPFFGWLIDLHAKTIAGSGMPTYTAADFQFAMWLLPIAFLAGLLATLFIKETHCLRKD